MSTRHWEIPANASPAALNAWVADIRELCSRSNAFPVSVQALARSLGIGDEEFIPGPLAPPNCTARDFALRGTASLDGEAGRLVDAALWRLWHRIPAARIWCDADPDAGIFADEFQAGGELADRLGLSL